MDVVHVERRPAFWKTGMFGQGKRLLATAMSVALAAVIMVVTVPGVVSADSRCSNAGVQVWSNENYGGYTHIFCASGSTIKIPNLEAYGGGGPLPGDSWSDVIDSFQSFNMASGKRSCWSTGYNYGGSTFYWGRNSYAPTVGTDLHDKITSMEINVSSCQ